jgi:FtsX-like permease family
MKNVFKALVLFCMWSLRRRGGQVVPVTAALLLLAGAAQSIGALHDVSSFLAQRQVAQSWRGSYDLLVRPQSTVSQPERDAGWIDPQSVLESYGGITARQAASIAALPHVVQIIPFATVGWRSIDVQLSLWLAHKGIYRISATWAGQQATAGAVVYYVEVIDLLHFTAETPLAYPVVQHLLTRNDAAPVLFTIFLPAVQAVIGIPATQQANLQRALLDGIAPAPALHLSLRVEKLRGDLSLLPACITRADCWLAQSVRRGAMSYQENGVQMLRYSRTRYAATPRELAQGQLSLAALGNDTRGPIYRTVSNRYLPALEKIDPAILPAPAQTSSFLSLLPFSGPERMPLLAAAATFIPLEQACAINGSSCYSGLYVRLNGVEQYSQHSLALLQAAASAITARTGLHVDILDGSSPRSIALSAAGTGGPIQTSWWATGVAVQVVQGVDALQEALLALCSIVCLLAIGAAGALVGVGRRKDALLLRQLGWPAHLPSASFLLDAFLLCLPGGLLVVGWLGLATGHLASTLSPAVILALLGVGILLYCCTLIGTANFSTQGEPLLIRSYSIYRSALARALRSTYASTIPLMFQVVVSVLLIAVGYIMFSSFDQALVVTVLGKQVRETLEGPQLLLVVVVLTAALLTVSICARLQLHGRREELSLLSMVGWERRAVFLRVMWDSWLPALLSGELGALLAMGITMSTVSSPSLLTTLELLLCGPLTGLLLVSLAAVGPAWRETRRLFLWK